MNPVFDLLNAHRSIRKFTSQAIAEDLLLAIVSAGQSAATSSFLQGCTVIRVRNPESRRTLARLAGNQPYVESAAEFLACVPISSALAMPVRSSARNSRATTPNISSLRRWTWH